MNRVEELARTDPRYAARWKKDPPPAVAQMRKLGLALAPGRCVHLGPATGETVKCKTCQGEKQLAVHACAVYSECLPHGSHPAVQACRGCGRMESPQSLAAPAKTTVLQGIDHHFNASILEHRGRYVLASRKVWSGSQISLSLLDPFNGFRRMVTFKPHLALNYTGPDGRNRTRYGREDPRLFLHDKAPHLMYTGYERDGGQPTSLLFARIGHDLRTVERVWYSHYPKRAAWEKNWQPFSHGGRIYAVYSIRPHVVLDVTDESAFEVARTNPALAWEYGHLRGGAPPVLHNGEYYSFFHGHLSRSGKIIYSGGVYTFEAKPPFRITRFAPEPIQLPDMDDEPAGYKHVVFPGGAIFKGGKWILAGGYMDRECRLWEFPEDVIERALKPVGAAPELPLASPPPFRFRPGTNDEGVFNTVVRENEYKLPDDMTGQVILDIGAHIGSFAHACLERGAAKVVCVEPHQGSADLCRANLARYGERADVVHAAAWRGDRPRGTTRVRPQEYNVGGTALDPHHPTGPDVPASPLSDFLDRAGGRADLLKVDCEGSEFAILGTNDLSRIGAVCGEYHLPAMFWPWLAEGLDVSVEGLRACLAQAGFTEIEITPPAPDGLGHFWARRG